MNPRTMKLAWAQNLPATQKLVLVALADSSNNADGWAHIAQRDLAAKCGLSRQCVNQALQALKLKGLITIEHQFDQNGGLLGAIYGLPESWCR